jgi:hypothetical protein
VSQAKPPQPSFNAMLICDQTIREEGTGKVSLIGVFGAIHSNRFPVMHSSLSVYVNLGDAQGTYRLRLDLLRSDTMQKIGSGKAELNVLDLMLPAEFVFVLQSLVFERPGKYQFDLYANDDYVGSKSFQVLQSDQIPGAPR